MRSKDLDEFIQEMKDEFKSVDGIDNIDILEYLTLEVNVYSNHKLSKEQRSKIYELEYNFLKKLQTRRFHQQRPFIELDFRIFMGGELNE